MYLCRTLSYKGVEFEVIEAPLEDEMMVGKCDFFLFPLIIPPFMPCYFSTKEIIMERTANLLIHLK